MKTKDLTVHGCFFHAYADAYIVRGVVRDKTKHRAGQHVVGWVSRARPETLIAPKRYLDSNSAALALNTTLETNQIPSTLLEAKDWQKHSVYKWEDDLLVPQAEDVLNDKQARKILRKVARDFNIPCPKLVWGEKANPSEYDEDSNEVLFRHRDKISLLHEVAHAIVANRLGNEHGPNHSPGFVWTAIELYHRYAGIDLAFLIQSAAMRNLLGDVVSRNPGMKMTKEVRRPAARAL